MELFFPVRDLLRQTWGFFQNFILAIIVFVIGWILAKIVRLVITRLLKVLRIDSIAEQVKIADFLLRGGIKYTLSEIIGIIIYWIILLGVVISSLDILRITGVSNFLDRILGYLPNVIGSVIILIIGMFISIFVASIVRTTAANIGVDQANLLSRVVQTVVIVFSILVALEALQIGAVLATAVNIVLATIGLGLALAFGLGCKDIASRFFSELVEKLKKK